MIGASILNSFYLVTLILNLEVVIMKTIKECKVVKLLVDTFTACRKKS